MHCHFFLQKKTKNIVINKKNPNFFKLGLSVSVII